MSLNEFKQIVFGKSMLPLEIGALVELTDGRRGFVQNVRVSPYWPEECQGIVRVYIYSEDWDQGNRWVEWMLVDELEVVG